MTHLLVMPLGEIPGREVEATVARHFPAAEIDWLDRSDFRRRPLRLLFRLAGQHYDAAVLVAADLQQPRLRLTSFVLSLPRASRRWRIDLQGNREAFTLGGHVARNAPAILRHATAFVLAQLLAEPLLRVVAALIGPRPTLTAEAPPSPPPSPSPRGRRSSVRPSRILYLRSQLWLGLEGGGSVAHTAGVIGGLEQVGVDVQVVSSDRLPGVAAPTLVVAPETWFDGARREVEDLAYNVAFFNAALRTILRTRPQAIYQRHTAFNCSGALLSRVMRLPLVLEFNSSELWKGRYWGGLHRARAAGLVERINLAAADRVVVVSEVLRDQVVGRRVPSEKIVVIPNGVDPAQFRPDFDGTIVRRRLGLESSVVVGFSGTFGNWHGIPTLAEAFPKVCALRGEVNWLLIGDGPLRTLVEEGIEKHGLAGRVCLAGLVPHAEMPGYLAACDILVSPHGRQADGAPFFGSPTKLYEYMAAGRAIVASAVGQIAEVLEDEQSALLVPPDDVEALCQAIVRLVDDACLRVQLASAARAAAETRHTWRQNAEQVLAALL